MTVLKKKLYINFKVNNRIVSTYDFPERYTQSKIRQFEHL